MSKRHDGNMATLAEAVRAERETSELLRAEVARLRAQLPEGMQDCTIVFRQCSKGHGWLTATNWMDHGCPTCALAAAREALKRHKHTDECLGYAAKMGRAWCVAACADSHRAALAGEGKP